MLGGSFQTHAKLTCAEYRVAGCECHSGLVGLLALASEIAADSQQGGDIPVEWMNKGDLFSRGIR